MNEALIEETAKAQAVLSWYDEDSEAGGDFVVGGMAVAEALRRLISAVDEAHTPTDDEREALDSAVREVTWNASNYPRKAQPHILGANIGPLTAKIVESVEKAGFRRTVQGEPAICAECGVPFHLVQHDEACDAVQGEPGIMENYLAVAEGLGLSPDLRRQGLDQLREASDRADARAKGEETDAQVHAAAVAIDPAAWEPGIFYQQASGARDNSLELARAALRAALAVSNQGRTDALGKG